MRGHRALVVALTVLALALRLPQLDTGLWYDEIVTLVESVRLPLSKLLTAFPGYNNHPLYSLLAHFSIGVFGEHVWSLRLPAIVSGVASIPVFYWLGSHVTTRGEALLATLLLAVSYHHVWFSQNARGYTLLLMLALAATALLVRLWQHRSPAREVAYGVVAGLGVYTHLTMAFVVLAHALVWTLHVFRKERPERAGAIRSALVALGTAGIVSALLYLPMAADVYRVLTDPVAKTSSVATSSWAVLEVLRGLQVGFGTIGVLAVLLLIALGALDYVKTRAEIALLFVLPAATLVLALVVTGGSIRPRFFFPLLGFGLLMLVRGAMVGGEWLARRVSIATIARRDLVGQGAIGLVAVFSMWSLGFNYRYPKQDFEGARSHVRNHRQPTDAVATSGLAEYPFANYYVEPWTGVKQADELRRVRQSAPRTWVVYSFPEYMDRDLVAQIRRDCVTEATFRGTLGGGDVVVCVADGPR